MPQCRASMTSLLSLYTAGTLLASMYMPAGTAWSRSANGTTLVMGQ